MLFFDYTFHTAYDGSIIMDAELKPESLGVADGDQFTVKIVNGQVILVKNKNGHSRADQ